MPYIEVKPSRAPAEWTRSNSIFSDSHSSLCPALSVEGPDAGSPPVSGSLWDHYHIGSKFYLEEGPAPKEIPILSGIADTGSIATFTPAEFARFIEIVNSVGKKWPLQEVGTGRLKFHLKPDGSQVTYCGTIRPDENGNVAACKSKPYEHKIKGIPNTCKRRACPECYPDWSSKGGQRLSSILNGHVREIIPDSLKERLCVALEAMPQEPGPEDGKLVKEIHAILDAGDQWLPRHVVFSPDVKTIAGMVLRTERALQKRGINIRERTQRYRNEFHKVFMKKYRRKLDQVIRLAGLIGYAEITHDIRLNKKKEADKADRQMDTNRYRAALDQPTWRGDVHFSPHSHTAGWGYLMNADEFHKRTGWVYVNYGTVYSALGLANYLLSHAPDNPGLHSIRYCGILNPSQMSIEGEIKIPEFPPCEECIAEGKSKNKAEMVIAKLATVEYVRDEKHRTQIASWEFADGGISERPYRITKIIQVYRRRPPQPPRPPDPNRNTTVPWTWVGSWQIAIKEMENSILQNDRAAHVLEWLRYNAKEALDREEERVRMTELERKERERIRQAQLWVPRDSWIRMSPEDQAQHKWRQWYSVEEYAAAPAADKVLTFEWV